MSLCTQGPRGTADLLPNESFRWQYVEQKLRDICERFGYKEIRTPTFEHTELFARGVGESTDIVGKEMYTMLDKGGRSITLRPEGTANVARALLQHGVLKDTLPVRAYYLACCFRYEKPQSGRLREHHQLGIELFGAPSADADAETISVAKAVLDTLGITGYSLEINTIGCSDCRAGFYSALRDYFASRINEMCGSCNDRLNRNPLRILDCKSPVCKEIASGAPLISEYICDDCRVHFSDLKSLLELDGISYTVNPHIVRGQDYYSKTVFEFIHSGAGAQETICGGGRYDRLTEFLGADRCAGVGFGMGIERLLMVMESEGIDIQQPDGPELFLAYIGDAGYKTARKFCTQLRQKGVYALYDLNQRSLKSQLKYADKINAKRSLVIGDGEIQSENVIIRDMATGEQRGCGLDVDSIMSIILCN